MAAFTSKAAGDFNADGQTTWNEVGHPTSNADTVTITHAITAATAIVCGAITVSNNGSLDTGANAATITSITTAGNGVVTIGAGGVTFAGVLNNAGTGKLTINGIVTGITDFTPKTCDQNAAVTMSGAVTLLAASCTWNINANLTGFNASWYTAGGTVNVAAGVTITANTGSTLYIGGTTGSGSIYLNGTKAQPITLKATGGGYLGVNWASGTANGIATWVNATGGFTTEAMTGTALVSDCEFLRGAGFRASVKVVRSFFATYGMTTQFQGGFQADNLVIGYRRNGSASAPTNGLTVSTYGSGNNYIRNLIVNATNPVVPNVSEVTFEPFLRVDNFGHIDASMLPGTGSALDLAAANAGVGKCWYPVSGTIERSTTNPPTGKTYHSRLTPGASTSSFKPTMLYVSVPILSGDSITVTGKASRSGTAGTKLTSACADCQIDPEAAWFYGTSAVAWDLVKYNGEAGAPSGGYYDLPTCTASILAWVTGTAYVKGNRVSSGGLFYVCVTDHTSGTFATDLAAGKWVQETASGMVRVVFRLKEYKSGQFLDIGDVVITCGGTTYNVSMQNWANGMPVVDAPAASGGAPVFGGHVSRRV